MSNKRILTASCGTVLFFSTLIWLRIFTFKESYVIFWYPIVAVSAFLGFLFMRFRIRLLDFFFLLLIASTGIVNMMFVGNLSLSRLIYMCMSIFVAALLRNPVFPIKYIKALIYLNGVLILSFLLLFGTKVIYNGMSANYVSVYALILAVYYYVLSEHQGRRLSLFPAILTFIVCLFAEGRGGILCSFLLLFAIWICVYRERISIKWLRYLIVLFTLMLAASILVYFVTHIDSLDRNTVFSHFSNRGMESRARILMWDRYISDATMSPESLLLGYAYNNIPRIAYHEGNPHNSFIDIHGLNGGISFIIVVIMIIFAFRWAYKQGKWIYLICFSVFMLRGFTDRMFWGGPSTPVFFFFLLLPYHWNFFPKFLKSD